VEGQPWGSTLEDQRHTALI